MNVFINNISQIITDKSTLSQIILEQLNNKTKGIAVAVNEIVITKNQWENYILNENDKILIIKATQGG